MKQALNSRDSVRVTHIAEQTKSIILLQFRASAIALFFESLLVFNSFTSSDSILIVLGHAVLTLMQVVTVIGLVGFVVSKTGLHPADVMDTGVLG